MTLVRWACVALLLTAVAVFSIDGARASRMQSGNLIVSLNGDMSPHRLPRVGTAGIAVAVRAKLSTSNGQPLPAMRRITIRLGSQGRLDGRGLPVCPAERIRATTRSGSLAACGQSIVGRGYIGASVALPGQAALPFKASLVVFNARTSGGRRVLLGSAHSQSPPISLAIPFILHRRAGTGGATLSARLPQAAGRWVRIKRFAMTLQRRYRYKGEARSYISAGCPVPKGFTGIVFPLAQATFEFAGDRSVTAAVVRACTVRDEKGRADER